MAYFDNAYKKRQPRKEQRKPWRGVVYIDGRRVHLGRFRTYEEALNAELKEKQRYIAEWEEDHGRLYPYPNGSKQNV